MKNVVPYQTKASNQTQSLPFALGLPAGSSFLNRLIQFDVYKCYNGKRPQIAIIKSINSTGKLKSVKLFSSRNSFVCNL